MTAKFSLTRVSPMVLLAAVLLGGHSRADDLATTFASGNEAYEAGRYSEAAASYERVLADGGNGVDVLYNLGNSYARSHQIGRALSAYNGALQVAPRDADVLYNVEQIVSQRASAAPALPRSWLQQIAGRFVARRTLNELTGAALLILVVASTLGVLALLRIGSQRRMLAGLAAAGALLLMLAWANCAKYREVFVAGRAFASVPEAEMRTGPGEHFEVSGHLTDGAPVRLMRDSGIWVEVVLPTGKRAWVRREHTAQISAYPRRD